MSILKIIKERRTIRKYQAKKVPDEIIDKIIDAGVWGPSVPSFLRVQPWRFILVKDKEIKDKIADIVLERSEKSGAGVNILLHSAADIIRGSDFAVVVYNSGDMDKFKTKFKLVYESFEAVIKKAELSAISAAIQNMLLSADELGIGSCWLDTPLFCEKEINSLLGENLVMAAVLTFGYPDEPGKRAPRKPFNDCVKII